MGTSKVAIITGGGSGIGAATARLLHRDGYAVLVADKDRSAAEATAAGLVDDADAFEVDVADEASVMRLAEAAADLGDVAVLVNAAGIGSVRTAADATASEWDEVLAVNARGTFLCCKYLLPEMLRHGSGSIVNVASVAGLTGVRNRAAYSASKGAVLALTRAMALDHVAGGVRVNAVAPGTIDTPWVRRLVEEAGQSMTELRARQPMNRLGTAEEVAEAILYLATPRSSFATGSVLVLDGGMSVG